MRTSLFSTNLKAYFCINMCDKFGKQIWKGRTPLRIMILFNTVPNFLAESRDKKLIVTKEIASKGANVDRSKDRKTHLLIEELR